MYVKVSSQKKILIGMFSSHCCHYFGKRSNVGSLRFCPAVFSGGVVNGVLYLVRIWASQFRILEGGGGLFWVCLSSF